MKFTYTYRSSDGQRHTAEIEAENRDAAFAKLRAELGIKPIKVTAAEGPEEQGGAGRAANVSAAPRGGTWKAAVLAAIAIAAAVGAWWWLRRAARPEAAPYQVMTPQAPVTYTVATPLPRQAIPGSRQRIEQAIGGPYRRQDGGSPSQNRRQDGGSPSQNRRQDGGDPNSATRRGENVDGASYEAGQGVFAHAAERWLARYAEPGRKIEGLKIEDLRLGGEDSWRSCLRETIRIASSDFTEVVDLKRIVAGMKREMNAYLAGGGSVDGYLAELEKRQRLEMSYRERAEQKLGELLKEPKGDASRQDQLKAAYAYWLKANAALKSMGIYELPLPDALRAYQMGLDIEE